MSYRTPDPVVCLIWSRPPGEELAHLTPPELSEPGSEPRLWAEGPDSHPVFLPPPPRVWHGWAHFWSLVTPWVGCKPLPSQEMDEQGDPVSPCAPGPSSHPAPEVGATNAEREWGALPPRWPQLMAAHPPEGRQSWACELSIGSGCQPATEPAPEPTRLPPRCSSGDGGPWGQRWLQVLLCSARHGRSHTRVHTHTCSRMHAHARPHTCTHEPSQAFMLLILIGALP